MHIFSIPFLVMEEMFLDRYDMRKLLHSFLCKPIHYGGNISLGVWEFSWSPNVTLWMDQNLQWYILIKCCALGCAFRPNTVDGIIDWAHTLWLYSVRMCFWTFLATKVLWAFWAGVFSLLNHLCTSLMSNKFSLTLIYISANYSKLTI